MPIIRGPAAIRDAYRDDHVAAEYIERRFSEPLGALLHRHQAEELARVITSLRPDRVLEIAPGPARLTSAVAPLLNGGGTVMDASFQMLRIARERLATNGHGRWTFILGDAFNLPFRSGFDLVFTFRLIRHFELADRMRLYGNVHHVLRPGGLLMFDVVNEVVSAPLRAESPEEYKHYDALLTEASLGRELEEAGFRLLALHGVQHRYRALCTVQNLIGPRSRPLARTLMNAIDRFGGGEPLEWVATCARV